MRRNALFTLSILSALLMLAACIREPTAVAPAVTVPTPQPIDPADYAGWWQYTNCTYGFTLLLPPGWAVAENTGGEPLLIDPLPNIYLSYIKTSFRKSGSLTTE